MERLVNAAPDQAADAERFVPYTPFSAAERQLERHLGAQSKLLLPERHRRGWVRSMPWFVLAFVPFQLLGIAVVLGLTALTALIDPAASVLSSALVLAGSVLSVAALPGLFKRTRTGWALYTYSIVLGLLWSVITLSVFGTLISVGLVWLMFQLKYHYA
jgi:hypothetical protein